MAEIRAADEAIVTAGAPKPVGAEAGVERVFLNQAGRSPWGGELATLYTAELGGRHGARIARARAVRPLALGGGDPGREIEGPMAIVILGGLITSTLLSLYVLPTLALRYGPFRPRA